MSYPAILGLHLIAVLLFLACFFTTALLRRTTCDGAEPVDSTIEGRRLRLLNAMVATPALIGLWVAGGTLAIRGGWLVTGWLRIKIVLVVLLSVLHLYQTLALARRSRSVTARGGARLVLPLSLVLATAIVALVVAKPF